MISTAGTAFRKVLPHRNFMTPTVMGYYENETYVVELSTGTGITNDKLYGVTVVNKTDKLHDHNKSTLFDTELEALKYINDFDNIK